MRYRPEIDGLRAVAVLSVILFHAGFDTFAGGFVGVDVFFVISGYLITALIAADLKAGSFSLRAFYLRRARRILPALYLVTIVCIPFAWGLFDLNEIASFADTVFGVATFSSNIVLWLQDSYFSVSAEKTPLLHTWSLAVEEQYYLLFPVACLAVWRLGSKTFAVSIALAFCVSLALGDWASINCAGAAFFLLPTRAWEILAGALAALYLEREKDVRVSLITANVLSMIGLGLVVFAVFAFDANTPAPGLFLIVPVFGSVLVILFARQDGFTGGILSWRPIVGLGLISYSLYLWHQPTFAFARALGIAESEHWSIIILILLIVPLSYLSWRFVEKPFRVKTKFRSKIHFNSVIGSVAVLAALGWFGFDVYVAARYGASYLPVARQYVDPGGYVNSRWSSHVLRDFNPVGSRMRVVLIGDSYAQDLLNAVEETSLREHYDLSTYHISSRCGNVWTDFDLREVMDGGDIAYCSEHQRYDHTRLKTLISQADEVWLASSWKTWHMQFIGETATRLRQAYNLPVRFFGSKSFGESITFKGYVMAMEDTAAKLEGKTPAHIEKTNKEILNSVGERSFINLQEIICNASGMCNNITSMGKLISYDGGHLTPAGAELLGERLKDVLLRKDRD